MKTLAFDPKRPVKATAAAVIEVGALSCWAMGRARANVTLLGARALAISAKKALHNNQTICRKFSLSNWGLGWEGPLAEMFAYTDLCEQHPHKQGVSSLMGYARDLLLPWTAPYINLEIFKDSKHTILGLLMVHCHVPYEMHTFDVSRRFVLYWSWSYLW